QRARAGGGRAGDPAVELGAAVGGRRARGRIRQRDVPRGDRPRQPDLEAGPRGVGERRAVGIRDAHGERGVGGRGGSQRQQDRQRRPPHGAERTRRRRRLPRLAVDDLAVAGDDVRAVLEDAVAAGAAGDAIAPAADRADGLVARAVLHPVVAVAAVEAVAAGAADQAVGAAAALELVVAGVAEDLVVAEAAELAVVARAAAQDVVAVAAVEVVVAAAAAEDIAAVLAEQLVDAVA